MKAFVVKRVLVLPASNTYCWPTTPTQMGSFILLKETTAN